MLIRQVSFLAAALMISSVSYAEIKLSSNPLTAQKQLSISANQSKPSGKIVVSGLPNEKVNINFANAEQLSAIKGISEKKALAIIQYRNQHGSFKSLTDLKNIKGITNKQLSKLANKITY